MSINGKVRHKAFVLPASVHCNHGEIQRWDDARVRRAPGAVRAEPARGNHMSVQCTVAEKLERAVRDRHEHSRETVFRLLPRARVATSSAIKIHQHWRQTGSVTAAPTGGDRRSG